MRWVGPGSLSLGDGVFIGNNCDIPAGALSPEQIACFEAVDPPWIISGAIVEEPAPVSKTVEAILPLIRLEAKKAAEKPVEKAKKRRGRAKKVK